MKDSFSAKFKIFVEVRTAFGRRRVFGVGRVPCRRAFERTAANGAETKRRVRATVSRADAGIAKRLSQLQRTGSSRASERGVDGLKID